jgi:hypothetical protein
MSYGIEETSNRNEEAVEECRLLVSGVIWVYYKPTFGRNVASIFRVEKIM